MNNPKLIRADAKLQNLPEEALQELWRYRHPEEGGTPMTLDAIAAALPERFGFSIALSSLSGFYRWLELKRRMEARECAAEQLKSELARDPSKSNEDIKRAGQRLFLTEGIIERDFKKFAGMVKMDTDTAKLKQADKKIEIQKQGLRIDERKLAILEAKAAKADQASEVTNSDLTEEEKAARIKQIFHMG